MHPFAVRADPGGAVAHAPLVFLEALRADLEAADAVPAEGLFLLAAVAAKVRPAAATASALVPVGQGLSPRGRAATPAPSSRDRRQRRPPPGWRGSPAPRRGAANGSPGTPRQTGRGAT